MTDHQSYYNNFYRELAKIDEQNNSVAKIAGFLPELPANAKVLDIGCGFGSVSQGLVGLGCDVYGMEINSDALTVLEQKKIKPVKHDIMQPFTLNERFDLVLLLDVLEHVFDPIALLKEALKVLRKDGSIIISVPLYFDLFDRVRILFTGSILSYDNHCYGRELYQKFRSYSYDHIRFFTNKDILEMCDLLDLRIEKLKYLPITGGSINTFFAFLSMAIANRYTVNLAPGLLAHSMILRVVRTD